MATDKINPCKLQPVKSVFNSCHFRSISARNCVGQIDCKSGYFLQCNFAAPPIKRWNLFLYPLNDLLWPRECGRSDVVPVSKGVHASAALLGPCHVNKPKLACW